MTKKSLLVSGMMLIAATALSQSMEFQKMVMQQEEYISRNRWDDMLLTAPDMLIEEPTRGEGYYYTAYAFFKLNQPDKAKEYLQTAELYASDDLKVKIRALQNKIQAGADADHNLMLAEKYEREGNIEQAAEAWRKLWLKDKQRLDYALNAIGHYVTLKAYPSALAILNDPAIFQDPQAKQLIRRLNETSLMKTENGYNQAMEAAASFMKNGSYSSAIAKYNEALRLKPDDREAKRQKHLANDELAWQKASKEHTIESYENYLKGVPPLQYEDEANRLIRVALVYHGEQAASRDDIYKMEYYFENYLKKYPRGDQANRVKELMCAAYLRNGNIETKKKTASAQGEAITLFEKASRTCVGLDLTDRIRTAKRRQTRFGRPDRMFCNVLYDSISRFGVSIGSINSPGLGMFFSVRINDEIFTSSTYYTVDNTGKTDGSVFNDIRFTNNVARGNLEIMGGLTKKIVHPFWLYGSIGVSYNPVYWEMDEYKDNGQYYKTEWVKNTDETRTYAMKELGLILDLGGLNLRSGIKFSRYSGQILTLGIGFSLTR